MTAEKDFSSLREQWYQSPQGQGALQGALHVTQKALAPWHRRGHCILQMGFDHGSSLEFLWQSGFDVSALCSSSHVLESLNTPLRQCIDTEYRAPAAFDHLSYGDNSFDYVIVSLPPAERPYPALKNILREALRIAAKGVLFQGWNSYSLAGIQRKTCKSSLAPYMQACHWHSWRQVYHTLRSLHPQQRGIHASTLRTFSTLLGPTRAWQASGRLQKMYNLTLPLPTGALMAVRLTFKDQGVMSNIPLYVKPLAGETLQAAPVAERRTKNMPRRASKAPSDTTITTKNP